MPEAAILQIGEITHVRKEWKECCEFAVLKVQYWISRTSITGANFVDVGIQGEHASGVH